jgi:hypothetical protein
VNNTESAEGATTLNHTLIDFLARYIADTWYGDEYDNAGVAWAQVTEVSRQECRKRATEWIEDQKNA